MVAPITSVRSRQVTGGRFVSLHRVLTHLAPGQCQGLGSAPGLLPITPARWCHGGSVGVRPLMLPGWVEVGGSEALPACFHPPRALLTVPAGWLLLECRLPRVRLPFVNQVPWMSELPRAVVGHFLQAQSYWGGRRAG